MKQNAKTKVNVKEAVKANGTKGLPGNAPDCIKELAALMKYNSAMRICSSKAIIAEMTTNGEIKDTDKVFVEFDWNKVKVVVNGLGKELWYTEPAVLRGIANGFNMMSNLVQTKLTAVMSENNVEI